jgi:hypothetical protein
MNWVDFDRVLELWTLRTVDSGDAPLLLSRPLEVVMPVWACILVRRAPVKKMIENLRC